MQNSYNDVKIIVIQIIVDCILCILVHNIMRQDVGRKFRKYNSIRSQLSIQKYYAK